MAYASWRKCDFQVHTPRDPNWHGERPIGICERMSETSVEVSAIDVEAVRKAWVVDFVRKCLESIR